MGKECSSISLIFINNVIVRVSKWRAMTTQDIEHIEQKEIREGAVWSSKGQIRWNLNNVESYFLFSPRKGKFTVAVID